MIPTFCKARWLVLVALLPLLPLSAWAQDSAELDGNWLARYDPPMGNLREAKLALTGGKGSWQSQGYDRYEACIGKKGSAAVRDFDGQGFQLVVTQSEALAGCRDFTLKMKRAGDKSWVAETAGGRKITLERN